MESSSSQPINIPIPSLVDGFPKYKKFIFWTVYGYCISYTFMINNFYFTDLYNQSRYARIDHWKCKNHQWKFLFRYCRIENNPNSYNHKSDGIAFFVPFQPKHQPNDWVQLLFLHLDLSFPDRDWLLKRFCILKFRILRTSHRGLESDHHELEKFNFQSPENS